MLRLWDSNLSAKTAMIDEIRNALTGAKYDREGVAAALDSASDKLQQSEETRDASKYVQVRCIGMLAEHKGIQRVASTCVVNKSSNIFVELLSFPF